MSYPSPHLVEARGPVRLAEEVPGLRQSQRDEVTVETTTDYPVVRVVALEEEGLSDGQRMEGPGAAGSPEVDF